MPSAVNLETLRVIGSAATDPGITRALNEDAVWLESDPEGGILAIVADGVGGADAGEVASQLVVDTVRSHFAQRGGAPPGDTLRQALREANGALRAAQQAAGMTSMGSTCTALAVCDRTVYCAHVGDSRAYLLRGSKLYRLTNDHSVVGMQLAAGMITPDQVDTHPYRGMLMRAIGMTDTLDVEHGQYPLQANDRLIITSDGLMIDLTETELAARVFNRAPDDATFELVDLAIRRGAPDNLSVIVLWVQPDASAG